MEEGLRLIHNLSVLVTTRSHYIFKYAVPVEILFHAPRRGMAGMAHSKIMTFVATRRVHLHCELAFRVV